MALSKLYFFHQISWFSTFIKQRIEGAISECSLSHGSNIAPQLQNSAGIWVWKQGGVRRAGEWEGPEKSQHYLAWPEEAISISSEEAISIFSGNAGLIPSDRLGKADSLRDKESYCQRMVKAFSSGIGEVCFTGKKKNS